MTDWQGPTHPEAVRLLEATGLYHLRRWNMHKLNAPLLSAFIERWQPDTNTFHMPFGEMTITLHDVAMIMGIKVDGLPLPHASDNTVLALTARVLHTTVRHVKEWFMLSGVKFKEIRERQTVKEGEMGMPPSIHAVCYLMYLLGGTLFVNRSQDKTRPDWIHIIHDIERVSQYAWGAATLCYLYRSLGQTSRRETRQMSGCLILLEVFEINIFI